MLLTTIKNFKGLGHSAHALDKLRIMIQTVAVPVDAKCDGSLLVLGVNHCDLRVELRVSADQNCRELIADRFELQEKTLNKNELNNNLKVNIFCL